MAGVCRTLAELEASPYNAPTATGTETCARQRPGRNTGQPPPVALWNPAILDRWTKLVPGRDVEELLSISPVAAHQVHEPSLVRPLTGRRFRNGWWMAGPQRKFREAVIG